MTRPSPRTLCTRVQGFTLVELMITIAVLSIIAAIAIPAYNGYVQEARLGAARANIEPLRLALESHWLDDGEYIAGNWTPDGDKSLENTLGWRPDGDQDLYVYNVVLVNGGAGYTISVSHKTLSGEPVTFTKP